MTKDLAYKNIQFILQREFCSFLLFRACESVY